MSIRQRRYSKEELSNRGREIYESEIKQKVKTNDSGKVVAIDIETGAYEIGADSMEAAEKLLKRCPDAQISGIRVGYQAVHNFGFRPMKVPK